MTTSLDQLETEQRGPGRADLDTWPTIDIVRAINREDASVPTVVGDVADELAVTIDAIVARMRRGGRLVYVGAGTPGRLAMLDAAEVGPTFGLPEGRVVAVMAGGDAAFGRAMESGEDDAARAEHDLGAVAPSTDDVVIGITASGRTPYVLAALRAASAAGALTVGVSSNRDAALSRQVDHAIEVPTGPEVISGSTRMKAGTAQKLVLNTISTTVMVKLGRTYGDLMVDVRATNEKLERRAVRILTEATGASDGEAEAALAGADGQVKVALLTLLSGLAPDDARAALDRNEGHVRRALQATS